MRNDVDLWEIVKNIWEMAKVFDKRFKYVGIDLEILGNG